MREPEQIMNNYKKLLAAEVVSFPSSGKIDVSKKQGVYIIFDSKDKVLHVGKTDRGRDGLNQRLNNHLRNQSSFSNKYLKGNSDFLRHGCKFRYLEIEDARIRTLVEAFATGMLCPAHVGTGAKRAE